MKAAKLALACLLLLAADTSLAQTLVKRSYVIRAETTTVEQLTGMIHTCVLIYPDGRYRLERTEQSMFGGKPETKVYLDKLPDGDMRAWEAILAESNFQGIKVDLPHGGIVENMDTLYISIPREHGMQNLGFNNAAERKPYEKALKPFLNSLKAIEKRKVPVAKGETSNNCTAPQVMYRSTGPGLIPDSR